ncbi:MAG: uracil-DNA glycosylase [Oscillospiraceae bacterium]|nr:uracil-DNA glycosylase [Oscillospiraceae bacterium]
MLPIGQEWDTLLAEEFRKPYYQQLRAFLREEYASQTIHPDSRDIFNALRYTPYSAVRVVILGQDPYHGRDQAHGLSFSVRRGVEVPPSLRNIYAEIYNDLGVDNRASCGELIPWARQGVLLLNAVLTVREGQASSHAGHGWETFTDDVIRLLNVREDPIVFLLWGAYAQKKQALVTNPAHLILKAPHPSPLSAHRGFLGCRHFSQTNAFLREHGFPEIDWSIPE